MAFTMKYAPFRQEKTELTKPVEPDYTQIPTSGKRMVEVQSERPSGKTIRETARAIRDLGTGINADINTTAPSTFKQGSRIGALFGGEDFYKSVYSGGANMSYDQTEKISGSDSRQLFRDVKNALKSGQNVKVEGTNVSTGNKIEQEQNYNPQREAKKTFQKETNAYNQQEKEKQFKINIATREAKKAEIKANSEKLKAEKQEAFYVKYPNKRPKAENATSGESVAQQRATPFYQRGMAGDKMLLQNKNKIMSKSPLEQGKNPSSGETLQEEANRLAKEKLQKNIEGKPLEGSKDTRTETATVSKTTEGQKVEKFAKTKAELAALAAALKKNPDADKKYKSQTVTATGTASDTGKDNEIKIEIDEDKDKIPDVITKKPRLQMSFGTRTQKSQKSTAGAYKGSDGGSGTTCGCN